MGLQVKRTGAADYGAYVKALICGEPGCISGDAIIGINRAGKGSTLSMTDLYRRFNGVVHGRGEGWRADIDTRVQCEVDGVVRLDRIAAVYESGEKTTYRLVVADGRELRATSDHRFYTPDGWKPLGEVHVGGQVMVDAGKGNGTDSRKPLYRSLGGLASHPFARRKVKGSFQVPYHRLVAEAGLNALDVDSFVRRVQAGDVAGLLFLDPAEWAVHHLDHDSLNNDSGNLKVLTHDEHRALHAAEGGYRHVLNQTAFVDVVSIDEFGVEPTFDLTVENEPHNFLANGFVVHNSGKTKTAATWPNPLYANAEGGLMSVASLNIPTVDVTSSTVLLELKGALSQPPAVREKVLGVPVDTVVIDTIDEVARLLIKERLEQTNKDAMAIADWGWLGDQLRSIVRAYRNLPMNVIINCHLKSVEDADTGAQFLRPAIQGAMGDEIAGYVDIATVLTARPVTEVIDGKTHRRIVRIMQTFPDVKRPWIKDRSGKLPMEFPITFEDDYKRLNELIYGDLLDGGSQPEVQETIVQSLQEPEVQELQPEDAEVRSEDPVIDAADSVATAVETVVESVQQVTAAVVDAPKKRGRPAKDEVAQESPELTDPLPDAPPEVPDEPEAQAGEPAREPWQTCADCQGEVESQDQGDLSRIRFRRHLCRSCFAAARKR